MYENETKAQLQVSVVAQRPFTSFELHNHKANNLTEQLEL